MANKTNLFFVSLLATTFINSSNGTSAHLESEFSLPGAQRKYISNTTRDPIEIDIIIVRRTQENTSGNQGYFYTLNIPSNQTKEIVLQTECSYFTSIQFRLINTQKIFKVPVSYPENVSNPSGIFTIKKTNGEYIITFK